MPDQPPPNQTPVVDLDQARMQRGETMFVACPCEAERTDPDAPDSGWFVTAVLAGGRPVISTLVCTDCGRVADVTNGFMSTPEKRDAFPPRALQLAALDYATATVNAIATSIEAAALSPSSARAVWAEIIDQAQAQPRRTLCPHHANRPRPRHPPRLGLSRQGQHGDSRGRLRLCCYRSKSLCQ